MRPTGLQVREDRNADGASDCDLQTLSQMGKTEIRTGWFQGGVATHCLFGRDRCGGWVPQATAGDSFVLNRIIYLEVGECFATSSTGKAHRPIRRAGTKKR